MTVFNNTLLLASAATGGGTYQISRSLRFNSSDSAYLSRVVSSAGNRKTFTLSWWMKRSGLTTFQALFNSYTDVSNRTAINFDSSVGAGTAGDYLTLFSVVGGVTTSIFQTNALFRDSSAWYHAVVSVDTTQAVSTDRVKLWVNNTLQTFSVYNAPTQNSDLNWNSATTHYFGVYGGSPGTTSYGFNGYLAECYLIDGQALTPSSFGQTDANGEWQPIAYTGTYPGNSFKLNFADNSAATAAALGKDTSGNGNNWTPNNLSVTAGAGNDSLVDTPTSYGTDTGAGGEVRGNYATLNPLDVSSLTTSDGNLCLVASAAGYVRGTLNLAGKTYWEVTITTVGSGGIIGVMQPNGAFPYTNSNGYHSGGTQYINGSSIGSWGASWTTGDVIGIAVDADAGTITAYKNGTSQGSKSISSTTTWMPWIHSYSGTNYVNFGQRPFAFPVSGFKALCDTNLPAPVVAKPNTLMDVKLYTGNGGTQSIAGLGFSPDLVWVKSRSSANDHVLFDTVRGRAAGLRSNGTDAEFTSTAGNDLASFDNTGFTVGPPQNWTSPNGNGLSIVAWCWDAGSSNVVNTQGTITSTVRANASSGCSICTFTTQSTGTGTFGHGLNVAPSLVITKARAVANNWITYHASVGNTGALLLNSTAATDTQSFYWNNTTPSSTVVTLGTGFAGSNSLVAYCFAPVAGYSSFGSYTGNGSTDGPFVYTGFRPRWAMIKRTDSTNNWRMLDTARDAYNVSSAELYPNLSNAESSFSALDINSNGFKIRTTDINYNASAGIYLYCAFAESPFQTSRAR